LVKDKVNNSDVLSHPKVFASRWLHTYELILPQLKDAICFTIRNKLLIEEMRKIKQMRITKKANK
jgi:hypothetical protein